MQGVFCIILSVPQNIVMDLNDVNDPPHELLRNQTSFQPPPHLFWLDLKYHGLRWFSNIHASR